MAVASKYQGWRRLVDSSTSQLGVYSAGQKRFEVGSVALTTEGANTAALLHGVGTTTTPAKTTTADKNFIGYWTRSDATSGDSRGMYLRHYIGAAGSGEALRAYATIDGANAATGGTVNGAHVSLNVVGSGTISGAGNALRATLDVDTNLTPGGTLAAIQADSNFASGVTLPTNRSFIRMTDTGSVAMGYAFQLPAAASNSTIFATHVTQGMTHSIRILDGAGTPYYIMCASAATNRGGGS